MAGSAYWPRVRAVGPGAVAAFAAALAIAGCAAPGSQGPQAASSSTVSTATTTTTSVTARAKVSGNSHHRHRRRIDDGSLGNQATRLACKLLGTAQIRREFGGPVGRATPTYPYCQWLVGSDAFLALTVEPGVSFSSATQYVATLETIRGLGRRAIIANNRYLYFTASGTSYWLLWQQVGDFSELHTSQLVALAHDVLANRRPKGALAAPRLGPAGPPIYFAGDSTAAGPEWAWATYDTKSPLLRTLSEYQVGSGIVVPEYFDWSRHLLAVVAARRPRLVVYMGSANDGQELLVGGTYRPVGSPAWRREYGARVGSLMSALLREGSKVLWIGEPAMASASLSADMRVIDQVCAEQAARHRGVVFLNPGKYLNGPGGRYTATVLINGHKTPVRLDGIHLNIAGSVYLAGFISAAVHRLLGPERR